MKADRMAGSGILRANDLGKRESGTTACLLEDARSGGEAGFLAQGANEGAAGASGSHGRMGLPRLSDPAHPACGVAARVPAAASSRAPRPCTRTGRFRFPAPGRSASETVVQMLVVVALCVLVSGCAVGCGSADAELAARYDGGVIAEREVSDYTAAYRAERGYEDDRTWAEHLLEQGLRADTWRNQAIRALVEQRLVAARAEAAGIDVDRQLVEDQIASDKRAAGLDEDDEEEWEDYLGARGVTPEAYREGLEEASIRYQLLLQEVALDSEATEALMDDYIHDNLVSRVVRRYRALEFASREDAERALADLAGLSGEALDERFAGLLSRDASPGASTGAGGDVGWDIAADWGELQQELNAEMVPAGAVSATVHEADGTFYVLQCTDRFVFETTTGYADLPDDALKSYVREAALQASWSELADGYLADLVDGAHVQVRSMPSGLPYDVDYLMGESNETQEGR